MLGTLKIGDRYYVPREAQMAGHGWATVVDVLPLSADNRNLSAARSGLRRTYVIQYADGTRDHLRDSQ